MEVVTTMVCTLILSPQIIIMEVNDCKNPLFQISRGRYYDMKIYQEEYETISEHWLTMNKGMKKLAWGINYNLLENSDCNDR